MENFRKTTREKPELLDTSQNISDFKQNNNSIEMGYEQMVSVLPHGKAAARRQRAPHPKLNNLMKDGHIKTTEGQFVAVAIVSDEMRESPYKHSFTAMSLKPRNIV